MYTLVLFFLSAFAFMDVLSLSCYTTDRDFTTVTYGERNGTVQKCSTRHLRKALLWPQEQNFTVHQVELLSRCFKIVAPSGDEKFVVKGCILKSRCDMMMGLWVEFLQGSANKHQGFDCYECAGDNCNVASRKSLFGFAIVAVLAFSIL